MKNFFCSPPKYFLTQDQLFQKRLGGPGNLAIFKIHQMYRHTGKHTVRASYFWTKEHHLYTKPLFFGSIKCVKVSRIHNVATWSPTARLSSPLTLLGYWSSVQLRRLCDYTPEVILTCSYTLTSMLTVVWTGHKLWQYCDATKLSAGCGSLLHVLPDTLCL